MLCLNEVPSWKDIKSLSRLICKSNGWFRLWWRSALIRRTEQYDWLWNGGLRQLGYTLWQRLLWWRISSMVEKWHRCQHGNNFCQGIFLEVVLSWATSGPKTKTWPLKYFNSRFSYIKNLKINVFFHLVCHTNHCLK